MGTSPPLSVAAWVYPETDPGTQTIVNICDSADLTDYHWLFLSLSSGSRVVAQTRDDTSNEGAETTTTYSTGVWNHVAGLWASTSSRAAYLNGGSKGTDTTTIAPAPNRMRVGHTYMGNPYEAPMDGRICQLGIWNLALTDQDVAALAKGFSPLLVSPEGLVMYYPLFRTDQDFVGGYNLTPVNSPTWANNAPKIIMPRPAQILNLSSGEPCYTITTTITQTATIARTAGPVVVVDDCI